MSGDSVESLTVARRYIVVEIPLKPKKRTISLRVDEEAIAAIDKFVALSSGYSRTLILSKLVEGFAEGLKKLNYNASKVQLTLVDDNGSNNIEVVLPLRPLDKVVQRS